jgi:hypothetical protein
MDKKIFLLLLLCVIIAVSVIFNVIFIFQITKIGQVCRQYEINVATLAFRNMFTEKILLSDGEIDFDTRLTLESAVRELNDAEIFSQWQAFTKSETKEEATLLAKNLLKLLIKKTLQ